MCYECDSWLQSEIEFDGYNFCGTGCLNRYKERKIKDKQSRVEKIDQLIADLKREKDRLLTELGVKPQSYPWSG